MLTQYPFWLEAHLSDESDNTEWKVIRQKLADKKGRRYNKYVIPEVKPPDGSRGNYTEDMNVSFSNFDVRAPFRLSSILRDIIDDGANFLTLDIWNMWVEKKQEEETRANIEHPNNSGSDIASSASDDSGDSTYKPASTPTKKKAATPSVTSTTTLTRLQRPSRTKKKRSNSGSPKAAMKSPPKKSRQNPDAEPPVEVKEAAEAINKDKWDKLLHAARHWAVKRNDEDFKALLFAAKATPTKDVLAIIDNDSTYKLQQKS